MHHVQCSLHMVEWCRDRDDIWSIYNYIYTYIRCEYLHDLIDVTFAVSCTPLLSACAVVAESHTISQHYCWFPQRRPFVFIITLLSEKAPPFVPTCPPSSSSSLSTLEGIEEESHSTVKFQRFPPQKRGNMHTSNVSKSRRGLYFTFGRLWWVFCSA